MMPRILASDKLEHLQELTEDLSAYVVEAAVEGVPAHEAEGEIWERVLAMGRSALGEFFARQGDGDLGDTLDLPDGRQVKCLEYLHERTYRSIFGDFALQRAVYGTREGQKIEFVPLDQRLQLPESEFSYLLQDWSQSLGVEHAHAKVSETLEKILHQKIPVDSLERMNRQMSTTVEAFRDSRPAPAMEEEGSILVVTADNKGVPMRRPAHQAPVGAKRRKGEKANKKQMATLGCVYTVDPKVRTAEEVVESLFRERRRDSDDQSPEAVAQNKRVWSSLNIGEERGQDRVFAWLAEELEARCIDPQREIPCVMDGQGSLWKDQVSYLSGFDIVEILDLLHVTPRIWEATYLFHKEGSQEAAAFARSRILRILEGDVGYVIGGLRQMATKRGLRGAKLRKLNGICNYLEKNRHRLRYDDYLAKGYPIASGVIEGACRHLVKDRMERAGMRWTEHGAQAMLDLRSTYVNGQWDEFQTYRIEHETHRLYPHRDALDAVDWPLAA